MASHDDEVGNDELERLWRQGLDELAPRASVPDPARVERRRARLRLRRSATGAGIAAAVVLLAATAVFAAPRDNGKRVQTTPEPTTSSVADTTTAVPST